MAKLFVVVATVGRPSLARNLVDLLADQTRPADGVLVTSVTLADVEGVAAARSAPEIVLGGRGLCRQRNAALDALAGKADIVVFFDDDFVPAPDYLEQAEQLFAMHDDLVGITGTLIADGIHGAGYSFEDACALVVQKTGKVDTRYWPCQALYGCNMSIRLAAAEGLRFDEALPLYGWQEDIDFTYQLSKRGWMMGTGFVTGVHMGFTGGRTSGKRTGYSQIANIVYLKRKGTMVPGLGEKLLRQNFVSNLIKSLHPEAHIDRRGRLLGNLIAIKDWMTGRIDPRRIETL